MTIAVWVLTLVTLQRLGELVLAQRNTRALLAAGAREYGAGHYPMIVLLHAAWLGALWLLARDRATNLAWLGVFAVLQALRLWVIATLGRRWTTRIIVPPGMAPIRRGPYRWLNHPNYVVVVGEIAVLPLVFALPWVAALFSLLNAAVLWRRICEENRAMTAMAGSPEA